MATINEVLFIDVSADDVSSALRFASDSSNVRPMPTLVLGDVVDLHIVPTSNNAIDAIAASASLYTVKVGIGDIDGTYAYSDSFYASASYGWTGSLSLNNVALSNFLSGYTERQASFVVSVFNSTAPSSSIHTLLHTYVSILNEVISDTFDTSSLASYYTKTEADNRFLRQNQNVSGTFWLNSGNNVYLSNETYSVGIGTTTPSEKLDVRGNVYVSNNLDVDGTIYGTLQGTSSWATSARTASLATLARTASYVASTPTASYALSASLTVTSSHAITASYGLTSEHSITATYATAALSADTATTASYALTVPTASYVASTPTASFAISASNARSASYSLASSDAVTASYALTSSFIGVVVNNYIPKKVASGYTSSLITDDGSTIGINGPSDSNFIVEIRRLSGSTIPGILNLESSRSFSSGTQQLSFYVNKSFVSGSFPPNNEDNVATINSTGTSTGAIAFANGNTEVVRITSIGNFGIGTHLPGAKLHVQGNISASSITASLLGTSSLAVNALSSNYASQSQWNVSSSFASSSISSSFAVTASYFNQQWLVTASLYPITASWAVNALSSNYASQSQWNVSSSFASRSISASNAISSSFTNFASVAYSLQGSPTIIVDGDLMPLYGYTYDLGDASFPFQTAYINNANLGTITNDFGTVNISADLVPTSNFTQSIGSTGNRYNTVYARNFVGTASLATTASNVVADQIVVGGILFNKSTAQVNLNLTDYYLFNVATSSYGSVHVDYNVRHLSGSRAGTVIGVWNNGEITFNETCTVEIGSVKDLQLSMSLSASNIQLIAKSIASTGYLVTALNKFM